MNSRFVGLRLQNIYDINAKTFLLKFSSASSTTAEEGESDSLKQMIVIESGLRLHSTRYHREKNVRPSPFTMKLRKHLRTRRLLSLKQVGGDRIVDFEFYGGEAGNYHLITEFYASVHHF